MNVATEANEIRTTATISHSFLIGISVAMWVEAKMGIWHHISQRHSDVG